MASKKLTLTEDHLRLISNFRFGEVSVSEFQSGWDGIIEHEEVNEEGDSETVREASDIIENLMTRDTYGLDLNNLYGGSFLYEDISYLIGKYDEHIEGTEEDPDGVRFPEELEDYMRGLHDFIIENIEDIEELVHQFCAKGGLTPGTYKSKNNTHIWERVD